MATPTRMMLSGAPVPAGYRLIGYIDRHPSNRRHSFGLGVLVNTQSGVEVGWTGSSLVSLPIGWRERVIFDSVDRVADGTGQIREAILTAAKEIGLTHRELAALSGCSERTMSGWLRGERDSIAIPTLERLMDQLGLSIC